VFGFRRIGVVVSDLYFSDPDAAAGQEGAERGVRLEVRLLEARTSEGSGSGARSVYASRPILIGEPLWRVDLLESVANPGSLDRAHHHPEMQDWEPGARRFDEALSADPIGWLAKRLEEPAGLLEPGRADPAELEELRAAAPEIIATVRRLLEQVRAGELALPPLDARAGELVRTGWL